MPKLSKEAYNEIMSLLDNEIELNHGMGRADRTEELETIQDEIEGIGTY